MFYVSVSLLIVLFAYVNLAYIGTSALMDKISKCEGILKLHKLIIRGVIGFEKNSPLHEQNFFPAYTPIFNVLTEGNFAPVPYNTTYIKFEGKFFFFYKT